MTKLQVLSMDSAELLSQNAAAAATELLAALRGMQQLVSLNLHSIHSLAGCPPQAYSALTASSCLEYVSIHWCSLSVDPTIWLHAFGAGRPLAQLRTLHLTALGHFLVGAKLDSAALTSVAASCPSLQSLDISNSGAAGMQLQPLRQMQCLTQLYLSADVSDTDAADTLAHMTHLQDLRLASTRNLTDQGLLQLTVLRGLTQLELGLGSACVLSKQFMAAVEAKYEWQYWDYALGNTVYVIKSQVRVQSEQDHVGVCREALSVGRPCGVTEQHATCGRNIFMRTIQQVASQLSFAPAQPLCAVEGLLA